VIYDTDRRQYRQLDEGNSTIRDARPPAERAHAFLALGKLCLQDETLAKITIASMARELDICQDPTVRNTIFKLFSS